MRILHQIGQGEHGVPGWVGCDLYGERLVLERIRLVSGDQFLELEFLRALVANRQWQRLGDEDAAGEYGEVVFFGVRLITGGGSNAIDECRCAVRYRELPRKTA